MGNTQDCPNKTSTLTWRHKRTFWSLQLFNFGAWAKTGCQFMSKDALMMQVFAHWEWDSNQHRLYSTICLNASSHQRLPVQLNQSKWVTTGGQVTTSTICYCFSCWTAKTYVFFRVNNAQTQAAQSLGSCRSLLNHRHCQNHKSTAAAHGSKHLKQTGAQGDNWSQIMACSSICHAGCIFIVPPHQLDTPA